MPRLGTGQKVPVLTVGNPPVATITVQNVFAMMRWRVGAILVGR